MSVSRYGFLGIVAFMVALMYVSAQIRFHVGPVPYTLQNMAVVLSGLLLPPKYALASQLLYLLLIALGLPVAAGFRGGLGVLLGYTAGYLWAFPVASLLMSLLSRVYLRARGRRLSCVSRIDVFFLWLLSFIAVLPVYVLGYMVFLYYAVPSSRLYVWAESIVDGIGLAPGDPLTVLFIASVLVFIPQDMLMDHFVAVVSARSIAGLLESRGLRLD